MRVCPGGGGDPGWGWGGGGGTRKGGGWVYNDLTLT